MQGVPDLHVAETWAECMNTAIRDAVHAENECDKLQTKVAELEQQNKVLQALHSKAKREKFQILQDYRQFLQGFLGFTPQHAANWLHTWLDTSDTEDSDPETQSDDEDIATDTSSDEDAA